MKSKIFLVFGLVMMIFLVGGVFAFNETCAKEGEMYSFVYPEYPEHCCEGLTEWASGMDSRIVLNGVCVETGALKGAPVGICLKCGDSICGLNEDICNCPADCKADCAKNENNQSCCKNGICIGLFDDGLPSVCSDESLPFFYGCDVECNPVAECKNFTCITEPGKAYYPGTEKCCDDLKSILPESYYDKNCNKLDVVGAPTCAPCGNGKCESQYGEDKCNCAEDCKLDCIRNDNNKSCCKNLTCIALFDDGLPSSCSDGSLPKFAGCDGDCKPIAGCSENECGTDKDCWDNYQNCYWTRSNKTCKMIFTESEIRLPDYPNCSQGQGIDINYSQDVICTADVKECLDGSFVSRAGFNCEFMPCPIEKVGFFERIINWFKNLFI